MAAEFEIEKEEFGERPAGTESGSKRPRRRPPPTPLLLELPSDLIARHIGPLLGARSSAALKATSRQFAHGVLPHCMDPEPLFALTLADNQYHFHSHVGVFQWSKLPTVLTDLQSGALSNRFPSLRDKEWGRSTLEFEMLSNINQVVPPILPGGFGYKLPYAVALQTVGRGVEFRDLIGGARVTSDKVLRDLCLLVEDCRVAARTRAARPL
jgi:hypothetical protein